jgi:pSer/pThr/pTyr-binding forkhead associated (FHA) protein
VFSQLPPPDLAAESCSRCKTPRGSNDPVCRRCGQAFVHSPARLSARTLVLHQLRPQPSAQTWEVTDTIADVGRSGAVALSDQSVSRRHARIAPSDAGFVVQDLGSTNGTFINNRQISMPSPIADGDELGFGDVVLVAEVQEPSRPPGPRAPQAGATIVYGPDIPPPAADLTVSESATGPPVSTLAASSQVRADIRSTTTSRPVIVEVPSEPRRPTPRLERPLTDVVQTADGILAWLRGLEMRLDTAMQLFDRGGGRAAVSAFIAQAERVESTRSRDPAELQALTALLPTARRLLEAELALIDLLSTPGSDAHE